MNRRKILGMIGAAPVAAAAAPALGAQALANNQEAVKAARAAQMGLMASQSVFDDPRAGIDLYAVVRNAYRAGLISRETLASALEGTFVDASYNPADPELGAYRSFSAVAKERMAKDRQRQRAVDRFLAKDEGKPDFFALARKIAGIGQ
jgi:hypothetical protein